MLGSSVLSYEFVTLAVGCYIIRTQHTDMFTHKILIFSLFFTVMDIGTKKHFGNKIIDLKPSSTGFQKGTKFKLVH